MGYGYEFLEDVLWECKEVYEYTIIQNEKPFVWRISPVLGDTVDDNDYEVEFIDYGSGQRLVRITFNTIIQASSYVNRRIQEQEK